MRKAVSALLSAALAASCDGLRVSRGVTAVACVQARLGAGPMCVSETDLDPNSPQYREKMAAEKAALQQARREQAAALGFSDEEISALREASTSLLACWPASASDPCPKALITPFGQPDTYFGQLRNPREDPVPEAWECVRNKWPVLVERGDDDLVAALQPIKDVYVDKRSLVSP